MEVWTVGLNHRSAPLNLRERFAFASERIGESLEGLRRNLSCHREVAILSTCNRTEIYCAGNQVRLPQTLKWLADKGGAGLETLEKHTYWLQGDASARHAFRVASGLDSMVLGEPQILGQLKQAVRVASDAGALGTTLNQLFQRSFAVAKEVRSSTEIGTQSTSMAAAAVRLAGRLFENLKDTRVLFVGAGEMIELCAAHFGAKSPKSISVTNRSVEKARALAQHYGGEGFALVDLPARLHEFDIVVSCTASTLPLIGLGAVKRALQVRRRRPMFMLDLAVPRDIEPEVKALADVYLYTVDDLAEVVSEGRSNRQAAVAEAELIIDSGVRKFMAWLEQRAHVPMIQELNLKAEGWRQLELARALKQLEKGQSVEEVLEAVTLGLMKKMLNGPLRELSQVDAPRRDLAKSAVEHFFLKS